MTYDNPQPGYFRLRLRRGGVASVAVITHNLPRDPATGETLTERSRLWEVFIDGLPIGRPSPNPQTAGVFSVWGLGTQISKTEHDEHVKRAAWMREHRPDMPESDPMRRVDIAAMRMKDLLA